MAKKIDKQQIIDQYTISGLWVTMSGFIVLNFIKELINQNFLIHLYVDSLIAIIALFVTIHNLKRQYSLLKDKKPFIVQVVALVFGLFVVVLTCKSPFDVSFLILVIGMITSKKMMITELNK